MEPDSSLVDRLNAAQRASDGRAAGLRTRFEARTGHPRALVLTGEEARLWRELEAEDPANHAAADALVEEAIDAYLRSDGTAREALRSAFAEARYLRWRAGWVAGALRRTLAPGDVDEMRDADEMPDADASRAACRGALAAIALEGGVTDRRDTLVGLDALFIAALRAGIDPAPLFAEAGRGSISHDGSATAISTLLSGYAEPSRADALRVAARRRPDEPPGSGASCRP